MKRFNQRLTSARSGFTLIEVILAMFLLLIGASTLLGILSFGAGTSRTANLRNDANAALPGLLMELEETLFPLVVDEAGLDSAGDPIPLRLDLPVPGYPALTYGYSATPLPEPEGGPALEYLVDLAISWREGGNRRSVNYSTILLREVPFGERLRQRFVERLEPVKKFEHDEMLRAIAEKRERGSDRNDPVQSAAQELIESPPE